MQIGLLGLGTVGTGVVELIEKNNNIIAKRINEHINIKKVLVKDLNKQRSPLVEGKITDRFEDIIEDEEISVIVEVMGGEEPALTYIREALNRGKHVVTANKEVISKHGKELLELSAKNDVNLLFEASVGGGIPIIRPMKRCLSANQITKIMGILNGTTNYILSQMTEHGKSFDEALKEAQLAGYAESDPTDDIKGFDAARKIAILSSIAFNTRITADQVYTEGIDSVSQADIQYAKEMGQVIKLIAMGKKHENSVEVAVTPILLPEDHPLASVGGPFNAIMVEGNAVGPVMFYGLGAGKMPTASAVVADIMEAIKNNNGGKLNCTCYYDFDIMDPGEACSSFYIRLRVVDKPGVLAKIAGAFGENEISMAKVFQKNTINGTAEIVIVTYDVPFRNIQDALSEIKAYKQVVEVSTVIRVEEEHK
ncbi:MAG TPA: homoserine dehydrogenase [Thermoanaerobacterales bacterium]|uniref:homoserine dehydrogenase n=1 Tax=Tepidanaerobacter sp. GT38 TaxID=2722793 RepID=UPI0017F994AE|nr:homoserine dehydrogenase [Tepidanaerobacter sp. GT38]MCG1013383.1 homoserine dehydrogenase [Tepidanaerobacter sp. GT38]HHY43014.1 homoserine dehydrogenase [Thermoanaerobacterales bacterium]